MRSAPVSSRTGAIPSRCGARKVSTRGSAERTAAASRGSSRRRARSLQARSNTWRRSNGRRAAPHATPAAASSTRRAPGRRDPILRGASGCRGRAGSFRRPSTAHRPGRRRTRRGREVGAGDRCYETHAICARCSNGGGEEIETLRPEVGRHDEAGRADGRGERDRLAARRGAGVQDALTARATGHHRHELRRFILNDESFRPRPAGSPADSPRGRRGRLWRTGSALSGRRVRPARRQRLAILAKTVGAKREGRRGVVEARPGLRASNP